MLLMLGLPGRLVPVGDEFIVLCGHGACVLSASPLLSHNLSAMLQSLGGHQSLNLGCLEDGLLTILSDRPPDGVFSHIIPLLQVEQLADLGSSLGSESARLLRICESLNLSGSLLDHDEVEHAKVGTNDASTGTLTLAASTLEMTDVETLHAITEKDAHTLVAEDTLVHAETLLIISTADLEHITSKLST